MTLQTANRLHTLFTACVYVAFVIIFCVEPAVELHGNKFLALAVMVLSCAVFLGLAWNLVTLVRLRRPDVITQRVGFYLYDSVLGFALGIGIFMANQVAPSLVTYSSGPMLVAFSAGVSIAMVLVEVATGQYERFKARAAVASTRAR